jgi:hypothetical protein
MNQRAPRVAVIGQTDILEADCIEWMQEKLPNLADYDVVFINEVSLGD